MTKKIKKAALLFCIAGLTVTYSFAQTYQWVNGTSWSPVNNGLSNTHINSLVTDGQYIYAGTGGSGVWKRPLSELIGIEDINENNDLVVYPNPASDKVTITNNDNFAKEIAVSIFNITGQQIMSDKFKNLNKIELDISKVEKGIYFLKIQMDNQIDDHKLIIQ